MTARNFALRLQGRVYGQELTEEEAALAAACGLVIAYMEAPELVVLRGAVERCTAPDPDGVLWVTREGVGCCPVNGARSVQAVRGGRPGHWRLCTELPHETFEIFREGAVFCRGIVFRVGAI